MWQKCSSAIIIVCCSLFLQAQSFNDYFLLANNAFDSGDYETAIEMYEILMQQYEKLPNLQMQCANAYFLNLQYNEARALYKLLAKNSAQIYPEALFCLAQIEHLLGNKTSAELYYNKYIDSRAVDNYARAMQELQRLQFVAKHENIAITHDENSPFFHNYGVSLLNSNVVYNGVKVEKFKFLSHITFAPLLPEWEPIFSTQQFSYSDLQQFRGQTYVARRLSQTPLEKAELCMLSDSGGIAVLQAVENQPFANNGNANIHVHFALLNQGETVFFSSNRKGGFGGFDIWYCQKNEDGTYSEAHNAGSLVNSAGDEICPFFDSINQQLFFSSDWHNGMGGFDIFQSSLSQLQNKNAAQPLNFEAPINLGTPINSTYNDFYYKHLNGKAYFSSNRALKKTNRNDYFYNSVFYYALSTNNTAVLSQENAEVEHQSNIQLSTALFFRHDFPNEQSASTYIFEQEQYAKEITMRIEQLSEAEFSISNAVEMQQLNNFLHTQLELNSKQLQLEIQKLASSKGNVTIELQAFTSAEGGYEYNEKLAERRINAVANFIFDELQKANIAPNRVTFVKKAPVIQSKKLEQTPSNYLLHNANERRVSVEFIIP